MYYCRDPCDPRKDDEDCSSGQQGRGSKPPTDQRAGTSNNGRCSTNNHAPSCPNYQYNYFCPPTDDGGEECGSSEAYYWQACCACGGYHAQVKVTRRKDQCKTTEPTSEEKKETKKQGPGSAQTNGAADEGADAGTRVAQDPKWGILTGAEKSEFDELRQRIRSADDTICILKDRCQTLTQRLDDAEELNRCLREELNRFELEGRKRQSGGGSAQSSISTAPSSTKDKKGRNATSDSAASSISTAPSSMKDTKGRNATSDSAASSISTAPSSTKDKKGRNATSDSAASSISTAPSSTKVKKGRKAPSGSAASSVSTAPSSTKVKKGRKAPSDSAASSVSTTPSFTKGKKGSTGTKESTPKRSSDPESKDTSREVQDSDVEDTDDETDVDTDAETGDETLFEAKLRRSIIQAATDIYIKNSKTGLAPTEPTATDSETDDDSI